MCCVWLLAAVQPFRSWSGLSWRERISLDNFTYSGQYNSRHRAARMNVM